MEWLEQRRQERRWWTGSAAVTVLGLILGVIGVVPAFADLNAATCTAVESDGSVEITWQGAPEGLELVVLAQNGTGELTEVPNDGGDSIGFGPVGSWTGPAYPGAVAYHLFGDPEDDGGTLRCTNPATDSVVVGARNATGMTNPGFEKGMCPDSSTGDEYGWHFVAPGRDRVIESIEATFVEAGTVTAFVPGSRRAHVYVFTRTADEIVAVDAAISGGDPATARLVLSHVCSPDDSTAEPSATTTAEPSATTTPEPDPTAAPTAAPSPTASSTAPPARATSIPTTAPTSRTTTTTGTPRPRSARIEASLAVDCPWDAVVVNLRNLGDATGVAEIEVDGVVVEVVTVDPGERVVAMPETPLADTIVNVLVDGVAVATATLDDPCGIQTPSLSAEVVVDCAADTVTVSVSNTGDGLGTAIITIGVRETSLDVMPGMTEQVVVARPERDTLEVTVTEGANVVLDTSAATKCVRSLPELSADIAIVCDGSAPAARVLVTNTGNATGTATITVDGTSTELVVGAGASELIAVFVPGVGEVTVTVTAGDQRVLAELVDSDVCEAPAPILDAATAIDCGVSQIVVTVTNRGDGEGVAFVEINGVRSVVVVAAASEASVTADIVAGAALSVAVDDGKRSLLDETTTSACVAPLPDLDAGYSVNCASRTVTVTVGNDGDAAAAVTISLGDDGTTRRVGPGEQATASFPTPVGAERRLLVTGPVDVELEALIDVRVEPCTTPTPDTGATFVLDCQLGEIVVTVTNTGDADSQVTWAINDRTETVVVRPGSSLVVAGAIIAGADNIVHVIADGETVVADTVAGACVPDTPLLDAEIIMDCGNDEIVVRVINHGGAPAPARVVINGDVTEIDVPAGDLAMVRGRLGTDAAYLVDVSSGERNIITEQGVATTCIALPPVGQLSAEISLSCRRNEATVRIFNDHPEPRIVTVTFDGDAETLTVQPGATVEMDHPLTEDDAYDITVVDDAGVSLAFARGTHDCVEVQGTTITNPQNPTTVVTTTPMQLPNTGANTSALIIAGLTMVVAGVVAVRASQIRRLRLSGI